MSRNTLNTQLLLIDPQNDFCDLPGDWCPTDPLGGQRMAPALPVQGAHADMQRLARFIRTNESRIDRITVTLDSHQRYDVAHPGFWRKGDGTDMPPFTPILAKEVRAGAYAPRDPHALDRVLHYMDTLESQGRYVLMVWPVHCEIGSWGHGVHGDVLAACDEWQISQRRAVRNVFKGMNPWTEHYSAIRAEVPDDDDPETLVNERLLRELATAERLIVAGEAGSHCVRSTVEDIVNHLPALVPGWTPSRIVLLVDCMSPVGGFEREQTAFLESMHTRGVRLAQSTELAL
ncbi:cysteine hydrolase family protein [Diaphorobacter caeni]|uniref:cysteine hydrolase n=1 Tax=Diaphorobacter caeni TaxID=2784387 RepID=UPI0018904F4D|nr:cysteine hydrolase [Diaphorobacter caeni]MBF5003862.1 cysteine hydrolase [Diaphorobacter caeni]